MPVEAPSTALKFFDVGFNAADPVYHGHLRSRSTCDPDLAAVIERANQNHVVKMMVTGDDITGSRNALAVARQFDCLSCTVGIHPCRALSLFKEVPKPLPRTLHSNSQEPSPQSISAAVDHLDFRHQKPLTEDDIKHLTADQREDAIQQNLAELERLVIEGREHGCVAAFGEIGLDYDRLFFASRELQLICFERQLELATKLNLPLFLHNRNTGSEFGDLLARFAPGLPKRGIVHSFTGSLHEAQSYISMGFGISFNGCSLRTEEGLSVVRDVPLEFIHIESDAPWCEIKKSHPSYGHLDKFPSDLFPECQFSKAEKPRPGTMIRGRNEPNILPKVAWIIAQVKGIPFEKVAEQTWINSTEMFAAIN